MPPELTTEWARTGNGTKITAEITSKRKKRTTAADMICCECAFFCYAQIGEVAYAAAFLGFLDNS